MEFRGACFAIGGDNCVAIVSDRRLGKGYTLNDSNFQRVFKMQDNIMLGLTGLDTDVQTVYALLEYKLNMYRLREGQEMTPRDFAWMVGATLYEHRFGPYYVSPVVAGLQDGKPVLFGYDSIGCMTEDKFVCAGAAAEMLLGSGECYFKEGMNAQEIEDACINAINAAADRHIMIGWNSALYVMTDKKIDCKMVKMKQV